MRYGTGPFRSCLTHHTTTMKPRSLMTMQRQRRERGSIMLLTVLVLMVMVGMLALSIDFGYVLSGRTQLQSAIDAAALAAAPGMHAAIEPGGGYSHQKDNIIKPLAIKYAAANTVGRYKCLELNDKGECKTPDPNNAIMLDPSEIVPYLEGALPRVVVKHVLDQDPFGAAPGPGASQGDKDAYDAQRRRGKLPTIFAQAFGLTSMSVSAGAVATLIPVEGGTGLISGGWRPLLIPDTYFDSTGQVWAYGETGHPLPQRAQNDYYRSRFAGGAHNGLPFVDGGSPQVAVTSIRDTKSQNDLRAYGGKNLLAQRITIKGGDWRLVDFKATYPNTVADDDPQYPGFELIKQISGGGYNGYVRVGDLVKVYPKGNAVYGADDPMVVKRSFDILSRSFDIGFNYEGTLENYGYVKSTKYPSANTHVQVIPVLLCNPFDFAENPNLAEYRVTNIGAFFLQSADPNTGDLTGYFLREVLVGGLPLKAQNDVNDRSLLPVAVRLLR